jgi:hypothetical protein
MALRRAVMENLNEYNAFAAFRYSDDDGLSDALHMWPRRFAALAAANFGVIVSILERPDYAMEGFALALVMGLTSLDNVKQLFARLALSPEVYERLAQSVIMGAANNTSPGLGYFVILDALLEAGLPFRIYHSLLEDFIARALDDNIDVADATPGIVRILNEVARIEYGNYANETAETLRLDDIMFEGDIAGRYLDTVGGAYVQTWAVETRDRVNGWLDMFRSAQARVFKITRIDPLLLAFRGAKITQDILCSVVMASLGGYIGKDIMRRFENACHASTENAQDYTHSKPAHRVTAPNAPPGLVRMVARDGKSFVDVPTEEYAAHLNILDDARDVTEWEATERTIQFESATRHTLSEIANITHIFHVNQDTSTEYAVGMIALRFSKLSINSVIRVAETLMFMNTSEIMAGAANSIVRRLDFSDTDVVQGVNKRRRGNPPGGAMQALTDAIMGTCIE